MAGALESRYFSGKAPSPGAAMPIDRRLLEILCDPVTHVPVVPLSKPQLAALNRGIERGEVLDVDGTVVEGALAEGGITTDGNGIYRVDDGIPVRPAARGTRTSPVRDLPRERG